LNFGSHGALGGGFCGCGAADESGFFDVSPLGGDFDSVGSRRPWPDDCDDEAPPAGC
jgi:hypothetical protein